MQLIGCHEEEQQQSVKLGESFQCSKKMNYQHFSFTITKYLNSMHDVSEIDGSKIFNQFKCKRFIKQLKIPSTYKIIKIILKN